MRLERCSLSRGASARARSPSMCEKRCCRARTGPRCSMASATRVLLVDDDVHVLASYRRVLREFQVDVASDGRAAQTILSTEPIDVVVCDLDMPEVTGIELMTWAKEQDHDAAWIVLSGQATLKAAIQA